MTLSETIRDIYEKLDDQKRGLEHIFVTGVVSEVDHATGAYRVRYGEEGKEVESPKLRPTEHAGTMNTHMPYKKGQQVRMLNPGGVISKQSWLMPAGHSDENPRHSTDGDAPSFEVGNARLTMKNGKIDLRVGADAFVTLTEEHIELNFGGKRVVLNADKVLTDGKTVLDNGTRKVHYVGGKDSDGDIAQEGADGVFV